MARIFRCETLTLKDMTKMSPAGCAHNLNAAAIGVGDSLDSTRNFIVKTRPTTARIEF